MKFVIGCMLTVLIFTGCEKDISFDLDDVEPVLVVDAEIENDRAPVVVLTRSFSYFENFSPQHLDSAFVHHAEVYISNGSATHRLKEYSRPLFISGQLLYYYTSDSSDLSTEIKGAFGGNYELRVVSEGKTYLSSTSIPAASQFPDSLWFIPAPQNPDTLTRALYVRATDPPGRGNYYRYFTSRNSNEGFLPGEGVFDDQVIDGTTYSLVFPPGVNRNNPVPRDENFFYKGDTVTLKFTSINRASYTFWTTWEFAYQSIGNPFAQPNKVMGNISNGALGAFCGYAAGYRTLIAP